MLKFTKLRLLYKIYVWIIESHPVITTNEIYGSNLDIDRTH